MKNLKTVICICLFQVTLILGQTTCNNGIGRVLYERLPNQQLQGFDDDVVRDTAPPFRVLEKCQDLCLRDRTASNNLVRTCTSFDFQPGSRIASFSGSPEYEESTCYLTREQATPEGIGTLMLVPNSMHFTEVCLSSSRPERECPSRRYVFERHPRNKLKLPISDTKEITAANRSDCEDKCLNEFSFVCRSASFDSTIRTCILSRFTRRTHPDLLEDDPNFEYLENTCLNAERRCDGLAVFVKEENKRLGGPFEVDIFNNMTLEECQTMCLRAEKYFCRSVEFDDQTKQCILSEEDSISQKDDISISSSPTHHFYDLVCLDNQRGTDYPDNSVTSHLFSSGRRPDTAFQRYRNSRLGGEFHSEITGRSLSECLDECLRQTSFQCRSAVYSDRFRTCRLSRYNQKDRMRIIYDADYDYYENLMLNVLDVDKDERQPHRPDMGADENWRPPVMNKGNYPNNNNDKYPVGNQDKYPADNGDKNFGGIWERYPFNDRELYDTNFEYPEYNRYPSRERDRYPSRERDRYPNRERDRYPTPERNRYPNRERDRYPSPDRDRYPNHERDIYPSRERDRYPSGEREQYPNGQKYPSDVNAYPFIVDRHPDIRYLMNGRNKFEHPAIDRYPTVRPSIFDRYPAERDRIPSDIEIYPANQYGNSPKYEFQPYHLHYQNRAVLSQPSYFPRFGQKYDGNYSPRHPEGSYPNEKHFNLESAFGGSNIGGSLRPQVTRCEEVDNFKQLAVKFKMRRQFVRRTLTVPSLSQCQRECVEVYDFICRSFNYRDATTSTFEERINPNCELSDRDSRELDIHNSKNFDEANYDFYERSMDRTDGGCLDVSQTCNENGMEFTLRTPEGFIGRIYSYGFYDRCFFRGNGGTVNVLRISGPQSYPGCGTQKYGDTLTNIVVVQYSDNVQTGRDKRYNLTCVFRGPGEAVVTSGYIGAGSGSPIPIEYLPAENTLSSKIRLMILYQNRPTTTIAVGDPLTFRLEAQEGFNHITDIFATNVIARDPYSGRSIQLIDRFGCPVDPFVFPELDKLRDGDTLEARFNAFKIPESNFLVFEATVRSCREGCQPAYCPGPAGRSEPSFGRKKRFVNQTSIQHDMLHDLIDETKADYNNNKSSTDLGQKNKESTNDRPEQVREMIEVFETRNEMEQDSFARKLIAPVEAVCISPIKYKSTLAAIIIMVILLLIVVLISGIFYRKYWIMSSKKISTYRNFPYAPPLSKQTHEHFNELGHINHTTRKHDNCSRNMSLFSGGLQKTFATGNLSRMHNLPVINKIKNIKSFSQFDDPSEPIYTDPSLFERSRSLRSLSEEKELQET